MAKSKLLKQGGAALLNAKRGPLCCRLQGRSKLGPSLLARMSPVKLAKPHCQHFQSGNPMTCWAAVATRVCIERTTTAPDAPASSPHDGAARRRHGGSAERARRPLRARQQPTARLSAAVEALLPRTHRLLRSVTMQARRAVQFPGLLLPPLRHCRAVTWAAGGPRSLLLSWVSARQSLASTHYAHRVDLVQPTSRCSAPPGTAFGSLRRDCSAAPALRCA